MGTHEAQRGPALPAAPVPLPAPVPPAAASTWVDPVPSAPFLGSPPPAPVEMGGLFPPEPVLASRPPAAAPDGSSGLVPARPGVPASATTGFVPGAPVAAAAPTRLRWDEKRSRTRSSATTFGLTGRIVITVVVLLLVAGLSYGNPFGIPIFLIAAAWLLRDLWARARHVPPKPPAPATRPAAHPSPFASSSFPSSSFPPPSGPPAG